jgi:antitoxin VapB
MSMQGNNARTEAFADESEDQERKERRQAGDGPRHGRAQRIDRFLREAVWPRVPDAVLGQPISKAERETILGLGPEGV